MVNTKKIQNVILNGNPVGAKISVRGKVGRHIGVITSYDPRRVDKILQFKGIITNVGGRLSHLAIISRELGIACIVVPKLKLFRSGIAVRMDGESGAIEILNSL